MKTHINNNIENLRKKLNQVILKESDPEEIYTISTELDTWILKYYKNNKGISKENF